jgi:hypothetical protein
MGARTPDSSAFTTLSFLVRRSKSVSPATRVEQNHARVGARQDAAISSSRTMRSPGCRRRRLCREQLTVAIGYAVAGKENTMVSPGRAAATSASIGADCIRRGGRVHQRRAMVGGEQRPLPSQASH